MKGRTAAANSNLPERGAQVSVPEIWDVRRTIELRTAELAAVTRTDAEAAEIADHARAMARTIDDLATMTSHDIAFHRAVARASHNLLFVQILESLEPLLEVAVPTAWQTRATEMQRRLMVERHQSVAAAISRRDAIGATMAMSAHFDAAIGDMLRATRRMRAV
jgi:DNA-binding FadR family transcriptional regulator